MSANSLINPKIDCGVIQIDLNVNTELFRALDTLGATEIRLLALPVALEYLVQAPLVVLASSIERFAKGVINCVGGLFSKDLSCKRGLAQLGKSCLELISLPVSIGRIIFTFFKLLFTLLTSPKETVVSLFEQYKTTLVNLIAKDNLGLPPAGNGNLSIQDGITAKSNPDKEQARLSEPASPASPDEESGIQRSAFSEDEENEIKKKLGIVAAQQAQMKPRQILMSSVREANRFGVNELDTEGFEFATEFVETDADGIAPLDTESTTPGTAPGGASSKKAS